MKLSESPAWGSSFNYIHVLFFTIINGPSGFTIDENDYKGPSNSDHAINTLTNSNTTQLTAIPNDTAAAIFNELTTAPTSLFSGDLISTNNSKNLLKGDF